MEKEDKFPKNIKELKSLLSKLSKEDAKEFVLKLNMFHTDLKRKNYLEEKFQFDLNLTDNPGQYSDGQLSSMITNWIMKLPWAKAQKALMDKFLNVMDSKPLGKKELEAWVETYKDKDILVPTLDPKNL